MLYISDLDGTLLNNQAELSSYSREKLNELIRRGVYFTVASARSIFAIQKIMRGVDFKLPIIEFNGAFISEFATGKHLIVNRIQHDIVEDIRQMMMDSRVIPFISTYNGTEDCLYWQSITNDGEAWYYQDRIKAQDKRLRKWDNASKPLQEKVVCFTVIGQYDALKPLYQKILEKYPCAVTVYLCMNTYSPGWYWLTVHSKKASKSQAIQTLRETFGLSQYPLTVFGDNLNDMPMFELADVAVAVGNADNAVKAKANLVIGNNVEDSVVNYILDKQ